ncbi:hypothetical protein SCOR_07290 [Sulfidibacter corallicola]
MGMGKWEWWEWDTRRRSYWELILGAHTGTPIFFRIEDFNGTPTFLQSAYRESSYRRAHTGPPIFSRISEPGHPPSRTGTQMGMGHPPSSCSYWDTHLFPNRDTHLSELETNREKPTGPPTFCPAGPVLPYNEPCPFHRGHGFKCRTCRSGAILCRFLRLRDRPPGNVRLCRPRPDRCA